MTRRILVAPKVGRIAGSLSAPAHLHTLRVVWGEAVPGECVVRIPRRLAREISDQRGNRFALLPNSEALVSCVLAAKPEG
jgi:hypothetical protein